MAALTSKLTAVSLFSGAGGFCDAVRLAGYNVRCAVESDKHACRSYSANFPEVSLFEATSGIFSIGIGPGSQRARIAWRKESTLSMAAPLAQASARSACAILRIHGTSSIRLETLSRPLRGLLSRTLSGRFWVWKPKPPGRIHDGKQMRCCFLAFSSPALSP